MAIDFEKERLREEQLANNKARRALICLCIDKSFSMQGERIEAVNKAIGEFLQSMYENKTARDAVEVLLVCFGHDIEVKYNFNPLSDVMKSNKTIVADGRQTNMGAAVKKSLELLDKHIIEVNKNNYKPWLIIISDGEADDISLCRVIASEVIKRQRENKLKVKCMSMDDSVVIESLKRFSIDGEVENINRIGAMEFFSMLSRSISSVSQSVLQLDEF